MSKKIFFENLLNFLLILLFCQWGSKFIKIYWILHNVDKESDDNYIFFNKIRRKL